jgi:acyl-CoA thioesterase-1
MNEGCRTLKRRHCNLALLAVALGGHLPARAAGVQPVTILVVGDSLSAEYGLRRGSGWVSLLGKRLQEEKIPARVVNAGVSADTTAGGRSRLPGLLRQHRPDVVLIELGANDALRGLPLDATRDNLTAMVRQAKAAGAKVLLIGMEMPPNYGARYTQAFREVFRSVAAAEDVPLVPFLLRNVADAPQAMALFQSDGIHPNEQAQPILLGNVWPALRALLPR